MHFYTVCVFTPILYTNQFSLVPFYYNLLSIIYPIFPVPKSIHTEGADSPTRATVTVRTSIESLLQPTSRSFSRYTIRCLSCKLLREAHTPLCWLSARNKIITSSNGMGSGGRVVVDRWWWMGGGG